MPFFNYKNILFMLYPVCCYVVTLVSPSGVSRSFLVRMAFLPIFIKRFVVDGSYIILTGTTFEEVSSPEDFRYIEKCPF